MITAEKAKDIMQKSFLVTTEEEKVEVVLKRMIRTNAKEIPVLDKEKRVVADLTMVDLLKFLLN
jgi:CBS domain-containing protein